MAKTNVKAEDRRFDKDERLAGGFGAPAAVQNAEQLLRRVVMATLLWEDLAYQPGSTTSKQICDLVPQIPAETVASIAIEARNAQKLRHVPLLLARECARHPSHRHVVGRLLPEVIKRADELAEFLALYWADGRQPLAKQVKLGLARAFNNFDAYQFAKYKGDGDAIKLRDVMFMTHPNPWGRRDSSPRWATYKRIADRSLLTPDTWEVALSSGKDKRETWVRLIEERKLGALAFLRNLRNMIQAEVPESVIRQGFENLRSDRLLPLNFFAAADAAPRWMDEIEQAMYRCLSAMPKLHGLTHFIVDVSGSMDFTISSKSRFTRLDVAASMAVLAREVCESVLIWVTGGNDYTRCHETEMLSPYRGFALAREVTSHRLDGGGIFTRQCLEYIEHEGLERVGAGKGERTIVFSDSQDCDLDRGAPKPFSPRNYVVDVSAHTRGVDYGGVWTAEISGWSEHFLSFIAAYEASTTQSSSLQHP